MKRSVLTILFLLGALAPLAAAPPDVPESMEAKVGQLTRFVVKAEKGKKVAFAPAFKDDACFVERLYSDNPDTIRFLVQPQKSGEFVITFWTVGEGDYKQVTIRAGGTIPVPPNPPNPPPPPADPFVAAIKRAIIEEPEQNRYLVPALARVYAFGAERATAKSGDGQAYLADTWGGLYEAMAAEASAYGVAGKLPAVNRAVAAELKTALKVKDTDPLDAAARERARVQFGRVSGALMEATK